MTSEAPPLPCILLVDDERPVLEALARAVRLLFAQHAFEIVLADGPLQAIEAADKAVAQRSRMLVLSDFNMRTSLDGLQLLDEVRQLRPDARTVLLTAYPREDFVHRPEFGAIDAFLSKPFQIAELKGIIGPFLAGAS